MNFTDAPVSFPGLFGDWKFTASSKLLDIGNGVYWYGVLIAAGLLLGLWFCMKRAPRFGLKDDDILDTVLWAVPFGILGARLYYILFYLELFRNDDGSLSFVKMVRIWDGGLAIYGGLILGFLVAFLVTRRKKIPFPALTDSVVPGILIAQAIGRWGNFMNREAYGAATELPWRMRLWASESAYLDVHPTFLYESLWNLLGLALLCLIVTKRRRFDGQDTCFYFLWYGLGRTWIEGLRADSLYLFQVTLGGERVRVSQALSVLLVLVTAGVLVCRLRVKPADPARLWVNRRRADAAEEAPAPDAPTPEPQEKSAP